MEEKKKKGNAFVRWTEKHAEFWKFIKFNCAGALSNIPELATQLILVYLVFKCASATGRKLFVKLESHGPIIPLAQIVNITIII